MATNGVDNHDPVDSVTPSKNLHTPHTREGHRARNLGSKTRLPPHLPAFKKRESFEQEVWRSICETMEESTELKMKYTLEYTGVRACMTLIKNPLTSELEMKSVYETRRGELERLLQALRCKKYNYLWELPEHDAVAFAGAFERRLMAYCSKQLVLLADWAITADRLTSLPYKSPDICKNLFVSMCAIHADKFPGGGEECARHLVAIAVGVLVKREEETPTHSGPSIQSENPASTIGETAQLRQSVQAWYEGSFPDALTLNGYEPFFLTTKTPTQTSQPSLEASSAQLIPFATPREKSMLDEAYHRSARGHLLWQQTQDSFRSSRLEEKVDKDHPCTTIYTDLQRREKDFAIPFDDDDHSFEEAISYFRQSRP
ncbi:hypothetical protein QFC21_006577 [Naganishia friedmannii]|uniref:Uncharacterized protein n=1 Tax=Naganishia friedmannii TaxID=89922 RepID=A0ACC2V234_9TREE|nr:hypothetical protein QFC21_006577 [Naganishia friedmannii]